MEKKNSDIEKTGVGAFFTPKSRGVVWNYEKNEEEIADAIVKALERIDIPMLDEGNNSRKQRF